MRINDFDYVGSYVSSLKNKIGTDDLDLLAVFKAESGFYFFWVQVFQKNFNTVFHGGLDVFVPWKVFKVVKKESWMPVRVIRSSLLDKHQLTRAE